MIQSLLAPVAPVIQPTPWFRAPRARWVRLPPPAGASLFSAVVMGDVQLQGARADAQGSQTHASQGQQVVGLEPLGGERRAGRTQPPHVQLIHRQHPGRSASLMPLSDGCPDGPAGEATTQVWIASSVQPPRPSRRSSRR